MCIIPIFQLYKYSMAFNRNILAVTICPTFTISLSHERASEHIFIDKFTASVVIIFGLFLSHQRHSLNVIHTTQVF